MIGSVRNLGVSSLLLRLMHIESECERLDDTPAHQQLFQELLQEVERFQSRVMAIQQAILTARQEQMRRVPPGIG